MKLHNPIIFVLGIVLIILGILTIISGGGFGSIIPLLIGGALFYLGLRGGRTAVIIFGHTCIVVGCILITWGLYLLPYSKPTFLHIFTRPLFWGFISLFGGICANYHGFCQCILARKNKI